MKTFIKYKNHPLQFVDCILPCGNLAEPYAVLPGRVLQFCQTKLIVRTKFPAIQSGTREQRRRQRSLQRTVSLSSLFAGCSSAVSLCRRPGRHLELFHPVCAGIHAPAGENSWLFLDGYAGCVRSGKVCFRLPYAFHSPQSAHGCL